MQAPREFRVFRAFGEISVPRVIPAVRVPREIWGRKVRPVLREQWAPWVLREMQALRVPEVFRVPPEPQVPPVQWVLRV